MSLITAALYDRLSGDATLVGMLATYRDDPAIFTTDPVPGDADLPYIVSVGNVTASAFDTKTEQGRQIWRDVRCYAAAGGSAQAIEAMAERVYQLLHRQPLVVAGYGVFVAECSGPIAVDEEDAYGRVVTVRLLLSSTISGAYPPGYGAGGGIIEIQEDGVKIADVAIINFEGGGGKVTDEGGAKVTVDIAGGDGGSGEGDHAKAYSDSGQIIPDSVWHPIIFEHEVYDTGDEYAPETGWFIASHEGYLHVTASILFDESSDWGGAECAVLAVFLNNESVVQCLDRRTSFTGASVLVRLGGSLTLHVEAGDTVSIYVWQNSNGARPLWSSNAYYNWVCFDWIEPGSGDGDGDGGSSTFVGLSDTPAGYSGKAGAVVKVNSGSDGLEFGDFTPADIYVAANGNDGNDGLSPGAPKATLQAAVDLVPAVFDKEVTIHVASGAILESGIEIKGKYPAEPGDRLLLRGYMNATPNQFSDVSLFSGTMTAGATNAFPDGNSRMTDATKNFGGAGSLKYRLLHITGGTGYDGTDDEFNWYIIENNGVTTIDIAGRWNGATPDATTTYEVFHNGECTIYGNGVNTSPVLEIYGCKNVVVRFIRWLAGTTGWGAGASGYPVISVVNHEMTAMPHLYLGTQYPELVWLGVGVGAMAVDDAGVNVQTSRWAAWASYISGYTTTTQGDRGLVAGRSLIDLRHFRMENLDYVGVYLVGGQATLACGTINNQVESLGFRAAICADAVSLLIEGRYLWLLNSYRGAHSLAGSHMYFSQQNVIESHGSHGCLSQASSQIELDGSENKVRNNGGWGAYAQHSASGDFSRAAYAGNASGDFGADGTSAAY